jgi:hypothetical protein
MTGTFLFDIFEPIIKNHIPIHWKLYGKGIDGCPLCSSLWAILDAYDDFYVHFM